MANLIYLIFNIYILGLIIYTVLTWIQGAQSRKLQGMLAQFYLPLLLPIRRKLGNVRIGKGVVDFAPAALLIMLIIARKLVIALLILPF